MALITVPDVQWSGFYYPEIFRDLLLFLRRNREELGLTDENDFEVHVQLVKAFSFVGHLNNTRLDTTATELLMGSATLLESMKQLLRLIGVELSSATPAAVDALLTLSAATTGDIASFIPALSEFSTGSVPPISFEDLIGLDLDRTDNVTAAYGLEEVKSGSSGFVATSSPDVFKDLASAFVVGVSPAGDVNRHLFVPAGLSANGGEFRIVEVIDVDTVRVTRVPGSSSPGFQDETGLSWSVKQYTADAAADVNAAGPTFTPWATPVAGDLMFVGHNEMLAGQLDILHGTVGSGITGVFEYFDDRLSLFAPSAVTDNGDGTITFDCTSLLALADRTGASVVVENLITGSKETVSSVFSADNEITTQTTLGQIAVSTDIADYLITADWVPFENQADGSVDFTQDGNLTFNIPQTADRSWRKSEINLVEGYWIRYRIISVSTPVSPIIDELDLDGGLQYLVRTVTQGETIGPQIIGSSDGSVNQEFALSETPFIDDTELIEVDEAGGGTFIPYLRSLNLLNATAVSRLYVRETSAEDEAAIRFGDGTGGKIPPIGVDNIRATYRVGGDIEGDVGISELSINADGVPGISAVTNPRAGVGFRIKDGGTAADIERLRRDAPAELRTRGTGSNVGDIENLAVNGFVDADGIKPVARAVAVEEGLGVKTIKLLVVGAGGATLTSQQKAALEVYFNGDRHASPPVKGVLMSNYAVTVFNFEPKLISVQATVTWPGGNAESVRAALLQLLTPLAVEEDGVTYVHDFNNFVSYSRAHSAIHAVDPNVEDVPTLLLNAIATSVNLGANELPVTTAASININIQETG